MLEYGAGGCRQKGRLGHSQSQGHARGEPGEVCAASAASTRAVIYSTCKASRQSIHDILDASRKGAFMVSNVAITSIQFFHKCALQGLSAIGLHVS